MHSKLKRKLAIGASALAAAAFAGGAYASTQVSKADFGQTFLNDVAKRLKVTPAELAAAFKGAFSDQLQAAVAAGRLTQAQAKAIKQHVQDEGFTPLGPGRPFGLPGLGAGGFGAAGLVPPGLLGVPGIGGLPGSRVPLPPGDIRARADGPLAAAAKYLGLSRTQLVAQLAAGKSLAQVAVARGKPVTGLKDAISSAQRSLLDKAVASKLLTSAQEQQILQHLSSQLDQLVNQRAFGPRFGARMFFGHRDGYLPPGPVGPPDRQPGAVNPAAPPAPGIGPAY